MGIILAIIGDILDRCAKAVIRSVNYVETSRIDSTARLELHFALPR